MPGLAGDAGCGLDQGNIPAQPAGKSTAEKVRPNATLPGTQGKQGTALDPDGDTVINAIPFEHEEGLDTVEPEIKAKPFGIGGDDSIAAEDTTAQVTSAQPTVPGCAPCHITSW